MVTAGSFGSRLSDGVNCVLAVLGEVLEPFHGFESTPSNDRQRGVPNGGQHLWRVSGVGSGLILSAGDVAHVMQTVLNSPMLAR